ncbi:MAG: hypothetical protein IKP69_02105 [Oscillospiraceae bacterium]|nr:hypothetical protein [Oscillospiraceae bacterium]
MKHILKKTMFTLLTVSILASAMTGCGKKETEAETTPETTVATEAATEAKTEITTEAETTAETEVQVETENATTEETALSAEAEPETEETANPDEPDYNTMFYDLIRTAQTSFQNSDATAYNDATTERLWYLMKAPMYKNTFNADTTTTEGQDTKMASAMSAIKNDDYKSIKESNVKWLLYDDVTIQGIVFQEQLDKDWYTALHHMIDNAIAEHPESFAYSTSDAFFADYPIEDMAVVDHVQDRIYLIKIGGEWLVDTEFYPLLEEKGTDGITKFDAYLKDENGNAIGY